MLCNLVFLLFILNYTASNLGAFSPPEVPVRGEMTRLVEVWEWV